MIDLCAEVVTPEGDTLFFLTNHLVLAARTIAHRSVSTPTRTQGVSFCETDRFRQNAPGIAGRWTRVTVSEA